MMHGTVSVAAIAALAGCASFAGATVISDTTFDSALNRFEHFERKIDAMESEIEAKAKGRGGIAAEFAALEKEGRIEQELAALKARLQRD